MTNTYIFSIDLGGTSTKLALLQEDGTIFHQWEIPTDIREHGKNIVKNIQTSFENKIYELELKHEQFIGVGMGSPGPVLTGGVISAAVNLGWKNYPIQAMLEENLKMPAFVGNDANCAALGEMWKGAGQGVANMILITLGTGVGGGVITNGNIVVGTNGGGGEIGHMTVKLSGGYSCNCGKKGCLETVASATGVVHLAKEKLVDSEEPSLLRKVMVEQQKITAKDVFDCAKKEDPLSLEIVDEVGYYLGYAIANLCATTNPSAVVLGGGVSRAGDILLDSVQKYYDQFAFPATKQDSKILLATLGNNAGLIGAGWLVKNNVID